MARCATRCKNGEKYEMRVFRCYGTRSRAAGSRRTVTGKSGLLELALLLSVRSPVSPATFLTSRAQKMTRNAKCAFFVAMALGRTRQAAGETLTGKLGLPEVATVKLFFCSPPLLFSRFSLQQINREKVFFLKGRQFCTVEIILLWVVTTTRTCTGIFCGNC